MANKATSVGKQGKSGKNSTHARERARQLKAEQERRDARKRLMIRVGVPLLVVLAVIATLVIVKVNQQPAATTESSSSPASATVTQAVAGVPAATFDTVGVGTVAAASSISALPSLLI